jgi:hypothetical protein
MKGKLVRKGLILAVLCAAVVMTSGADTIHLKTGVAVDGVIKDEDSVRYVVQVGKREVSFRKDQVVKIEQNEKTGLLDVQKLREEAQRKAEELFQKTGVTPAQRIEINSVKEGLIDPESEQYAEAKRRLVAMAEEMAVFDYFENLLESISPRFAPALMDVMAEIDPQRVKPVLRRHATDISADNREMVMRLMGRTRDQESAKFLARGMLDHVDEVRIAAAESLAVLRVKDATPALLENINHVNRRVANAALAALQKTWGTEDNPEAVRSVEEWQTVALQAPGAWTMASLEPLVEPGTRFVDE